MKNKFYGQILICMAFVLCLVGCTGGKNSGSNIGGGGNNPLVATEYTTTFVTNGGTGISPLKGTISFSPTTTKSGYDFVAWCKDPNLYQAVTFPFTPTQNTTLYAKWAEKTYSVESITLNKTEGYVYSGIPLQLKATISPENASDKTLTWTSSNPNCASVSNTGLVTYSGNGSTTITATAKNGVSQTCTVEGHRNLVSVNSTSGSLRRDDGVYGSYSNVTWSNGSVSNEKVNGYVSFKFTPRGGSGTRGGVYIYLKSRNGDTDREYWYQFGMISAGDTLDCVKDITIPAEDVYTISIGNGQWWKY